MTLPDSVTHDAGLLFRDGRVADAIDAAGAAVKHAPGEAGPRILLAELLLFQDRLERADTVLDAAQAVDPGAALVIAEFRQLLRAAMLRRQVLTEGRLPEFLGEPSPSQRHLLEALTTLRAGDAVASAQAASAAEAARPAAPGELRQNGVGIAFDDFRDADDLWSGTIELLTSTGKYFWVPVERIASMVFHPAQRPRDLVWRRCTMVVSNGPDGDVYIPALYDMPAGTADRLRLGRGTEWSDAMPVRGSGQRTFLVGEDGQPIQLLTEVEFA